MSVDVATENQCPESRSTQERISTNTWLWALLLAIGAGFILVGGGRQDLGYADARLGLAAREGFGPLGQAFGSWEPTLWPGKLGLSTIWAWGEGRRVTSASVRWPDAIAGLIAGVVLAGRARRVFGARAAVFMMLAWCGTLGLMDRTSTTGLDMISGLALVIAIDRLLSRGSDWVAGFFTALAFLAGGWPPVALVGLLTIVLGRRETNLRLPLLIPPALAAIAWSVWSLQVMSVEVWTAAFTLPLTRGSAWTLPLMVLVLGLPWSPLAGLVASRSVREGWTNPERAFVKGWLQTTGVCILSGTAIPGLGTAAGLPALAGLAFASAAVMDRLWSRDLGRGATKAALAVITPLVLVWLALVVPGGIYIASAVSYYRPPLFVLVGLSLPIVILWYLSLEKFEPRRALIALGLVALSLKIAHMGCYAPEWNYRFSQGPWGRAVGQWVPPRWPVYVTTDWSPALAFAIDRPVRRLASAKLLTFQKGQPVHHVLLHDEEFKHWPDDAPPLVEVASFTDERGGTRVLARTEGEQPWRIARQQAQR